MKQAARIVAAVVALGACLALAQAPLRTFEIQIAERRAPPAQRVLRATEGERVELRWGVAGRPALTAFTARLTGRFPIAIHGESGKHRHRALLHVEIHPR